MASCRWNHDLAGLASLALVILCLVAGAAYARPARPAQAVITDPILAERGLDGAAASIIQRLPTCEVAINTRVSEWKASALIACKKSAASAEACVAAQLTVRAEQLKRARSCKFL